MSPSAGLAADQRSATVHAQLFQLSPDGTLKRVPLTMDGAGIGKGGWSKQDGSCLLHRRGVVKPAQLVQQAGSVGDSLKVSESALTV